MTDILEQVAQSDRPFVPHTPEQYLALQIARKLGALSHTREYAILLEHYPERLVLGAFRLCHERGDPGHDGFLSAFRSIIHAPEP